ncbi:MAG: sigma-70 family RNA polymerase sigma factor [Myxococcota bacterium]
MKHQKSTKTDRKRIPVQLSPKLGDSERNYVYSVAMKYVKDEEAAADVAQETLLLAHRHRDSFRGDSRFSTWLYRVAATTSLMYLRKKRRRSREMLAPSAPCDDAVSLDSYSADCSPPEDEVARREAIDVIKRRLDELGDKYQRIFWMRYLEGYTETEIASRLDLTLATVKTRAHRARVAVRDSLRAADQLRAAA